MSIEGDMDSDYAHVDNSQTDIHTSTSPIATRDDVLATELARASIGTSSPSTRSPTKPAYTSAESPKMHSRPQSTLQLVQRMEPSTGGGVSLSDWLGSSTSGGTEGSRERPRRISDMSSIVNNFRLGTPKAGGKASKHYPVKLLALDEVNLNETGSNVSPIGYYYVDMIADVASSRSRAKDLASTGYYELSGNTEPLRELHAHLKKHFTSLLAHSGITGMDLRLPVYGESVELSRVGIRVFEASKDQSGKRVSSGVEVKKVQGDPPVVCNSSFDDPDYLRYSGKIRVVFTVTVLTIASTYAKLVFNAKDVILSKPTSVMVGGLRGAAGTAKDAPSDLPSGADPIEWGNLKLLLKEMVESGVPIHVISNTITSRVDKKIQGMVNTPHPPSTMPLYTQPSYMQPSYMQSSYSQPTHTQQGSLGGAYPLYQSRLG